MNLAKALEDTLIYDGINLQLNLSFDKVLTVFEVFQDQLLEYSDKLMLCLQILIKNYETLEKMDLQQQNNVLQQIMDNFIKMGGNDKKDAKPVVDFFEDAEYIYSSFYHDYGIDLFEQRGILHWQKFLALFKGLSKDTKMHEIMEIRQKPIPAPTKYNAEEICAIREAKAFYALHKGEREENFDQGINDLANILWARAAK